jgi:hypothetical protein
MGTPIRLITPLTKLERLLKLNGTDEDSSKQALKSGRLKGISGDLPSNDTVTG